MTVVSDSSPPITPARIRCFDLLPKLYGRIHIPTDVYKEVVMDGAGLPGASQVAQADWIEAHPVQNIGGLNTIKDDPGWGTDEIGAVVLAMELSADLMTRKPFSWA